MPHHPLTRILAVLIVVLAAVLLFWPGEIKPVYQPFILGTMPVFVAAFTWNAVRGTSPFNEYGFHRTLPGGDRAAFRRVLGIHGMLFAGILLALLGYAALYNLRWPDLAYALAFIFLPPTAFCGLIGTLATLGSAGRRWRIPVWGGLVLAYVASWALLGKLHSHDPRPLPGPLEHYYLSGERCALLVAVLVLPLCWWLVARHRRKLSALLGTFAIAVLIPWIHEYWNFVLVPPAAYARPLTTLNAVRKPLPADLQEWPMAPRMLDLGGLQEGEFGRLHSMEVPLTKASLRQGSLRVFQRDRWPATFAELPTETWVQISKPGRRMGQMRGSAWYGMSGGQLVWGQAGVWQHLRKSLPAHQSFEFFDDASGGLSLELGCFVEGGEPSVLALQPWQLSLDGPLRWEAIGHCKATSGGQFRLPRGGVIRMGPLVVEEKRVSLRLRHRGAPFGDGFPWFGEARELADPETLMLLMMDKSGTRAFALGRTYPEYRHYPLGEHYQQQLWTTSAGDPERVNLLRGGTVYVFQAVWSRTTARGLELPAPDVSPPRDLPPLDIPPP